MSPSKNESHDVLDLAALYGLQTSYVDVNNEKITASTEVLLALLRDLGVPIESARDAAARIADRERHQAHQFMSPVIVARDDELLRFRVTVPVSSEPDSLWFSLHYEDGEIERRKLLDRAAPMKLEVHGETFLQFEAEWHEEDRDRYAYHELRVEVGSTFSSSLVIRAPRCPVPDREWGLFLPQHALRTENDWGVGTYSDLAALGAWAKSHGAAMVGGLPLYPIYMDAPIDPSPYRPVSRLAYNELFIDPLALPELAQTRETLDLLSTTRVVKELEEVRASRAVDYDTVASLHRDVLEPIAEDFFSSNSSRRNVYDAFVQSHPELLAYASFRAAVEIIGREATLSGATVPTQQLRASTSFQYHAYCQWAASEQLASASKANALYSDLPIGSHPEGFDPYWSPQSFLSHSSAGAPPDSFFDEGQNWGFPPLHPDGIRRDGYQYVRAIMRRAFASTGFMRIDHVMGLQRLYVIPESGDAHHGAYLSYHPEELHAIVALEAHRADAVVIGEDLGTVDPDVRKRMKRDHMLRSWVFEFESTKETPLPEPPENVLATLATHDMPRFSSFLWGHDIDEAESLHRFDKKQADRQRTDRKQYRATLAKALNVTTKNDEDATGAIRRGCFESLAASPAAILQIDLEELFGEDQPQNRPGTVEGNWQHRSRRSLEEARDDVSLNEFLDRINELRRKTVTP